ncbi:hypothetical protein GALMADRAFT_98188 [Galerina marginata CBS 339.88]|uniref:Uncharacterized protein n=1 Tax=Galerina marginata (strain CBS 339.88) TaxID=685588 RepID=A0A067T7U2_GALM3|nr:hypothetical protein GALMADRAFT_98188 [Galerina marginata CBS 339.88]
MSSQRSARQGFSFIGMVGGVMALLKLKGKYDECAYRQAADDDEEGRVALTSPSVDNVNGESRIALLDTEIPNSSRRTRKKKACCMCCGVDCGLLWKAIGIVLGLFTLYYGYKALRWSLTDAPTGLEDLPAFSTSLGCLNAPYTYNKTEVTTTIPIGTRHHDHAFDIRGWGVGTITILDGDADSKDVKYEMTIGSDKEDFLDNIQFVMPDINEDGIVTRSRYILETSNPPGVDTKYCMRFDVKMYIPPNLKKLHVASHANTHLKFAPGARAAKVEELFVTLFTTNENNIIVSSADIAAEKISLEVYRGWIVGDASVVSELDISTQRGDGVTNLKITPSAPSDPANPEKAFIRTTTGAGRSDLTVITKKEYKRQIESTHTSSRNADMYLTYRQAEFNGKVELVSKSYTVTGAKPFKAPVGSGDGENQDGPKWTHFVGNQDGTDAIYVNSRGWTGLYF